MTAKPTSLRSRLKEETTRQILAAAETELSAKGLAATGMHAIAQRAGVSVGTLYNYFEDKEVLLATLLADRRREFAARVEEAIASHAALPFATQCEAVVRAIFETFEVHRDFLRITLENEKPVPTRAAKKKDARPGMWLVERLRPLTDKGVKDGHLDAEDAHLYPVALAALVRGVMVDSFAGDERPFADATRFVTRVFLEGARARS